MSDSEFKGQCCRHIWPAVVACRRRGSEVFGASFDLIADHGRIRNKTASQRGLRSLPALVVTVVVTVVVAGPEMVVVGVVAVAVVKNLVVSPEVYAKVVSVVVVDVIVVEVSVV